MDTRLPRFLGPFPLGWTFDDPLRPFPDSTIFAFTPSILIPFIPFGIFEYRFPIAVFANEVVKRLNG